MIKYTFTLALCFITAMAFSQEDKNWKNQTSFGLNFNNTQLSTYWNGGGQSAIALNGLISSKADYTKGRNVWNNSLDLGLGWTRLGKKSTDSVSNPFTKLDDRIILISNYGYKFKEEGNWSMAAGIDFRTQMLEGNDASEDRNKISNLLAPGYLISGLGIKYNNKAGSVQAVYSPVAFKNTFVLDDDLSDAGAFGVDSGSSVRSQFGSNLAASYTADIMKNVNFKTGLNLFGDYSDMEHIDLNWDATLGMQVNKYITASVGLLYLYDHDIKFNIVDEQTGEPIEGRYGPRNQFSNVINVGFIYKLANFEEE